MKGVQTVIKALPFLPDDMHVKIVGDGDYKTELERLNKEEGDRALFLGARNDVPLLLHESDIFVFTPEWEEGFGIVVIEALAAGKICIVSKSGALSEIITDGVNGFIVEKSNPRILADKIIEVSHKLDSVEMVRIRQNAKRRAMEFSMEEYSRKLDGLLES